MTLTEFLLARVAEDERVARAASISSGADWSTKEVEPWGEIVDGSSPQGNPRAYGDDTELWDHEGALGMWPETARHVAHFDPARMLAECEAKRDIIGFVLAAESGIEQLRPDDRAMRALALPYADHPDYQPEWKP